MVQVLFKILPISDSKLSSLMDIKSKLYQFEANTHLITNVLKGTNYLGADFPI